MIKGQAWDQESKRILTYKVHKHSPFDMIIARIKTIPEYKFFRPLVPLETRVRNFLFSFLFSNTKQRESRFSFFRRRRQDDSGIDEAVKFCNHYSMIEQQRQPKTKACQGKESDL